MSSKILELRSEVLFRVRMRASSYALDTNLGLVANLFTVSTRSLHDTSASQQMAGFYFSKSMSSVGAPTLMSELKSVCDVDGIYCQLVIGDIVKFITDDTALITQQRHTPQKQLRDAVTDYLAQHNATLIGSAHSGLPLEATEKNFRSIFGNGVHLIGKILCKFQFKKTDPNHVHLLALLTQLASFHAVEHLDNNHKKAREFHKKRVEILTELFTVYDSYDLSS
jgi:hypothetical protein